MVSPEFSLRPAVDADREVLLAIYTSTRESELAILAWSEERKREFLELQSRFQDLQYRSRYPDAAFDVVVSRGRAAGRLYVDRSGPGIHVIDVALLPAHRGSGLGTALLEVIVSEADATGRTLTLSVEGQNRVRSLYERLGFRAVEETGVYVRMERDPRPAGESGYPP